MLDRLCRLLASATLATGFTALGCGSDDDGGGSIGGDWDDPTVHGAANPGSATGGSVGCWTTRTRAAAIAMT